MARLSAMPPPRKRLCGAKADSSLASHLAPC